MKNEKSKIDLLMNVFVCIYGISFANIAYVNGLQNTLKFYANFGFLFSVCLLFTIFLINKFQIILTDKKIIVLNILLGHLLIFINKYDVILTAAEKILKINKELIAVIVLIIMIGINIKGFIKINKNKRMLILSFAIFFINLLYTLIFNFALMHEIGYKENTYKSIVRNEVKIKECNNFLSCTNIRKENIDLFLVGILKSKEEVAKESMAIYYNEFIDRIKDSSEEVIGFSYSPYRYSGGTDYLAIGAYSEYGEYMIVDYKSIYELMEKNRLIRDKLIGSSTFVWMLGMMFLTFLHGRRKVRNV